MNHDHLDDLTHPVPSPSHEVEETAWLSASCEFLRSSGDASQPKQTHHPVKWIWPLSAVATIGILCAVLFAPSEPIHQPTAAPLQNAEIENLFLQGQHLFGNRLKAVSISGNQVIWHLHHTAPTQASPTQVVTLTIQNKNHPNIQLAAYTGIPVDIEYQGKNHELEFLPNETGQVIAYGNDIFWDSGTRLSPITFAKYSNLPTQ